MQEDIARSHPQIEEVMRARITEKWGQHEDRKKLRFSLVPIMVMPSKYDTFKNHDSVLKKILCLALRHISHLYGADLVFPSV